MLCEPLSRSGLVAFLHFRVIGADSRIGSKNKPKQQKNFEKLNKY
jgi:hypothetical protein